MSVCCSRARRAGGVAAGPVAGLARSAARQLRQHHSAGNKHIIHPTHFTHSSTAHMSRADNCLINL